MGTERYTPEEWLDWADEKHEQAKERWLGGYPNAARTMRSYKALQGIIQDAMAHRAGPNRRPELHTDRNELLKLADELESFRSVDGPALTGENCAFAAQRIRKAVDA